MVNISVGTPTLKMLIASSKNKVDEKKGLLTLEAFFITECANSPSGMRLVRILFLYLEQFQLAM